MKPVIIKVFNCDFYIKEFVTVFICFLLTEPVFSWIFVQSSAITLPYVKLLSLGIYAFVILHISAFRAVEKVYILLFSAIVVKLVIESLLKYGSVFEYLEIYTVLFPVIFTFFIKFILRRSDLDLLEFIAKFYLFIYIVFMILFGHGFSLELKEVKMEDYGPFSGDTRIIHAASVYMIIIPFLWYLNKYITIGKNKFLLGFFCCFLIILLHQHRSVWSSAIAATAVYLFTTVRTNPKAGPSIIKAITIILTLLALSFVIVLKFHPSFINHFSVRFSEILHPDIEKGTASFRIKQSIIYFKLFLERPLMGWSFDGYEMSNPLVNWWPQKTGQHFHVGYIEMLFYHGITGLFLKYSLLVFILIKVFSRKLSAQSIILTSFSVSGLIFSLGFTLPLIFWGNVGMCLYYMEKMNIPERLQMKCI